MLNGVGIQQVRGVVWMQTQAAQIAERTSLVDTFMETLGCLAVRCYMGPIGIYLSLRRF